MLSRARIANCRKDKMSNAVIVTGGTGFLGSYISELFASRGFTVLSFGRGGRLVARGPNAAEFETVAGSNLDEERGCFAALLDAIRPAVVVHAAGVASVPISLTAPAEDFEAGPRLLFSVLDGIRLSCCRPRVVFLSSAAVYGNPQILPIREDAEVRPISPYGFHKLQAELICREFAEVYDFDIVGARIFSAFGAGLRRQVVWDICRKARSLERITLFGTGAETRDFIHARDVAAAVFVLATSERRSPFEVVNIGSGRETSIRDLATKIIRWLGLSPDILAFDGQSAVGAPLRWRADIARLKSVGYEGAVDFDLGLVETVAWCVQEQSRV